MPEEIELEREEETVRQLTLAVVVASVIAAGIVGAARSGEPATKGSCYVHKKDDDGCSRRDPTGNPNDFLYSTFSGGQCSAWSCDKPSVTTQCSNQHVCD